MAYLYKRQYDRAIEDFDEAIRLNPKDAVSFNSRGAVYQTKGQYDRAIQDYDEAIRLNPKYSIAIRHRGSAYAGKGQYDRAIQDYDDAIRLDPWEPSAFQGRGRTYLYLNRFAEARVDFYKAMELKPWDAYTVLWIYLTQARDGKDGRGELERNMERLDLQDWPRPIFSLYLGKTTPEAVLAAATDADRKKEREKQCQAYLFLGEYALVEGNRTEAVRLFKQAIDTGATTIVEYYIARNELKRLGQ